MSQVMKILTWLASLGPKLPTIITDIEDVVTTVEQLIADVKPAFAAAPLTLTTEEQDLLEQCENKCAAESSTQGFTAAPDGHRIKNLLAFLAAHPELIALILKLI
jgi:hypothetical protein